MRFILGVDVIMSTPLPLLRRHPPRPSCTRSMNFVSSVTGGSATGFVFGKPGKSPNSSASCPRLVQTSPRGSAFATSSRRVARGRSG